jgi:hypothetical protein
MLRPIFFGSFASALFLYFVLATARFSSGHSRPLCFYILFIQSGLGHSRAFRSAIGMSALGHKRTFALQ